MSKYDPKRLDAIYSKTDGYCHLCYKKLSRINYGRAGSRGAWQVEHSVPKAKGGSNRLNNLYPACIKCNLEKGTRHTKTIRNRNGHSRAPYSKETKQRIRSNNAASGALVGGGIGLVVGGPVGGLIGSFVGSLIGNESSPEK